MIDYRELLRKYMALIVHEEGVSYVNDASVAYSDDIVNFGFTNADVAELELIAGTLGNVYRTHVLEPYMWPDSGTDV